MDEDHSLLILYHEPNCNDAEVPNVAYTSHFPPISTAVQLLFAAETVETVPSHFLYVTETADPDQLPTCHLDPPE